MLAATQRGHGSDKLNTPACDEQGKTSGPSAESCKSSLPSLLSMGMETFTPAGMWQSRSYAKTTAAEDARTVEAKAARGEA